MKNIFQATATQQFMRACWAYHLTLSTAGVALIYGLAGWAVWAGCGPMSGVDVIIQIMVAWLFMTMALFIGPLLGIFLSLIGRFFAWIPLVLSHQCGSVEIALFAWAILNMTTAIPAHHYSEWRGRMHFTIIF